MTNEWHWVAERSGTGRSAGARPVGPEGFPTQGEAETWLGYIFDRPYVMDSSRTQAALGLAPSAWEDTLRRTGEGNR